MIGVASVETQFLPPPLLVLSEAQLGLSQLYGLREVRHWHGACHSLVGLVIADELVELDCQINEHV